MVSPSEILITFPEISADNNDSVKNKKNKSIDFIFRGFHREYTWKKKEVHSDYTTPTAYHSGTDRYNTRMHRVCTIHGTKINLSVLF